ncbi:hypothetical protein [Daejeonella sp.]|uniref:hypothetical protein n=1 Tax=Daejeonella sp. TaxID=2805397 RepID=UPI0030BBC4DE
MKQDLPYQLHRIIELCDEAVETIVMGIPTDISKYLRCRRMCSLILKYQNQPLFDFLLNRTLPRIEVCFLELPYLMECDRRGSYAAPVYSRLINEFKNWYYHIKDVKDGRRWGDSRYLALHKKIRQEVRQEQRAYCIKKAKEDSIRKKQARLPKKVVKVKKKPVQLVTLKQPPPILFDPDPQHDNAVRFLKGMNIRYKVENEYMELEIRMAKRMGVPDLLVQKRGPSLLPTLITPGIL